MATARSVLFASCVDDPVEHPELFPTSETQDQERMRLLEMTEKLCAVESSSDDALLSAAKKEILRYAEGTLPAVYDPFVGGGAIPVEAQRLGLKAESSDLNPVAVMITKLVADVPARFSDTVPVHPQQEMKLDIPLPGAKGYAEDVQYYGEWMLAEAKKRIGYLYPQVTSPETGADLEASAWIWARTASVARRCGRP